MTARIKGLVVTLGEDVREDEIESVVAAIRMVRGVASTDTRIVDHDDHMNRERIKYELRQKLWEVLG